MLPLLEQGGWLDDGPPGEGRLIVRHRLRHLIHHLTRPTFLLLIQEPWGLAWGLRSPYFHCLGFHRP
ncbi:hypothetical protein W02_31170 [Nitrospira sp. KM1]|nr:hypothetical protein W02_31170 [Nitrospira sp. KM1]